MFSSLRTRLWLSFAVVIAVVLVVTAVSLLLFVARSNLATRVDLRNAASRILQRQMGALNNPENFDELAARLDESGGLRTLIVNRSGEVAADSQADQHPTFQIIRPIPQDPIKEVLITRDVEGRAWLYTGKRLKNGYAIVIAQPRQPIREVLSSPISGELMRSLVQSGAVAFVISLVLAFLISRSVAKPLQTITAAARQVAGRPLAGGERITVKPEGPREVRQLGEAFNEMSAQVDASMQSQRDLVANVSHELKTPLTSVQGFAQAMLDGTADTTEAQQQAAQVIYDEAGRMNRLVLDLLDLARLDTGTANLRRDRVDLDVLLNAVVERFIPQSLEAEVALTSDIHPLPDMIGDGDRLSQVFNNLVDNALKHTPAGGRVWLAGRVVEGWIQVSVTDTGPGIPQDELGRVFERFYQLDKARQGGPAHGAGLGLAIASEIVSAHGGKIEAKSQEGKGSVFLVWLPDNPSGII